MWFGLTAAPTSVGSGSGRQSGLVFLLLNQFC